MSAPHFFVNPDEVHEISVGDRLSLSEEDSRHALGSLRLRPGQEATVANDRGFVGRGAVAGDRHGRAVIEIAQVDRFARSTPGVVVAIAPPKGDRLRWGVQKLAEIGVDGITLMSTERSVRHLSGSGDANEMMRLKRIAREAAMQSRRPFITSIAVRGGQIGDDGGPGRTIMLHQGAGQRLSECLTAAPQEIELLVGPEGGFTDGEVGAAVESGVVAASLGPPILRTETAAVVGAALVLARYGRLG